MKKLDFLFRSTRHTLLFETVKTLQVFTITILIVPDYYLLTDHIPLHSAFHPTVRPIVLRFHFASPDQMSSVAFSLPTDGHQKPTGSLMFETCRIICQLNKKEVSLR